MGPRQTAIYVTNATTGFKSLFLSENMKFSFYLRYMVPTLRPLGFNIVETKVYVFGSMIYLLLAGIKKCQFTLQPFFWFTYNHTCADYLAGRLPKRLVLVADCAEERSFKSNYLDYRIYRKILGNSERT